MRKRTLVLIVVILVLGVVAAMAAGAYYLAMTKSGAQTAARMFFASAVHPQTQRVAEVEGTLQQGVVYRNLELTNLKYLPPGTTLRIQELKLELESFSLDGVSVSIVNGRLLLPEAETVVFDGVLAKGTVQLTVYTHQVHVAMLRELIPKQSMLRALSGVLRDCEVRVEGTRENLEIRGKVNVEEASWHNIVLRGCPVTIEAQAQKLLTDARVKGVARFQGGTLAGAKTAVITLMPSSLQFKTVPQEFELNMRGTAKVENTSITITAVGTKDEMDMKVISDPPQPQARLLVMVITNQSWQGTETEYGMGMSSRAAASDVINYFLFGKDNAVAKTLGVDRFSVELEPGVTGAKMEKDISPKTSVSYEHKRENDPGVQETVNRTLNGDYKLSDLISLEAERNVEMRPDQEQQVERSLWFKFKKKY